MIEITVMITQTHTEKDSQCSEVGSVTVVAAADRNSSDSGALQQ